MYWFVMTICDFIYSSYFGDRLALYESDNKENIYKDYCESY